MASEQYSGGMQAEEENTKPSFMSKVKSKARKLKSKLKPHDSEASSGQAPAPRDPLDHYATGSADQDEDESDTFSSDEEEVGNQRPAGAVDPKSEGTPFGAVSSGQSGYGVDSKKTEDESFPVDRTVKSDGPPGTQQAVPTNYSYFNADPDQARRPSDRDDTGRQQGVPLTFAELTPATRNLSGGNSNPFAKRDDTLSKSGDRDSDLPLSSLSSRDASERNNVGLVDPSQRSQDSLLSHPIEQDQGVSDKDNEGYGGLAAAAATVAGAGGVGAGAGHEVQKSLSNESSKKVHSGMRSTSDPEVHDRSYTESKSEGFTPGISGTPAGTEHTTDTNFNVPSQEPTWTQKIYNAVVGAKDTVASHPVTQSATETAYGLKDSVISHPVTQNAASKLGYADQAVSTDSTPVSQKATDSAYGAKDSAASNLSASDGAQKPVIDRVTDSAYGLKDAVVSHPFTQNAASKLGYADQAVSTDSTPVSQKATDSAYEAKDSAASNLSASDGAQKPVIDRVTDSAYGLKDAVVSHPVTQNVASKLGYADQAVSTDSTPVSQKATDSAYEAKDSAASNLSASDGAQKPIIDRVTDSAYGLKDTVVSHPVTQNVASKLGYADQAVSTDSTPVSQKATNSAYEAKDSAASNVSANDGAQKPITNRVTDSVYGLKDTVASHPVTQKAYDLKDTVVSHPVTQQATNYAVQGKNYAANQLSYADQALSSDGKPVSTKTYEGAVQARDAAVQKTAPDHHDKALADSVTESISSLPGLLTSKLGLGGGTTASSPTTTSTTPAADASTFDPSTRKDTPFPDHSAATAPGLLDRVSGLASSLFGAAKQPASHTEGEKPASVEKYIP